jgi:geranylgeranyl diphosphate synthase, type I
VDLAQRLTELGALVDAWTREELARSISAPAARFGAMLEYHLGWRDADLQALEQPAPSGKKLRPALALLVSEAVCGQIEPARPAAVAVELVHNFSLVHDDIQDRSPLRRHRPTLWALWGMEQGINAGDALFALAQLVLTREETPLSASLIAELNATCLLLAEGQYLDIELQRGSTPPSLNAYEAMITRKTGVLFRSACRLGAMLAGAPADIQSAYAAYGLALGLAFQDIQSAYAAYGLALGLAFQEQDDLLGIWGEEAVTGKPQAADIAERKKGLPAAVALSREDAPAWLHDAYAASDGPLPNATVDRIIAHFDSLELRGEVERRVEAHHRVALDALERANPRSPAGVYLTTLCDMLIARRS